MEKLSKEEFKKPREIDVFREYLKERKIKTESDLKILSEKYGINLEILDIIRDRLRRTLNNSNYLSTTIHLRPRAIDFLELAHARINSATEDKVFYYPVYYQKFDKEKPDVIDIGEIKISLKEIIPGFKEKKFNYSIDFHETLMEYLNKEGWQEEVEKNLEDYLERKFFDRKKEEATILKPEIKDTVVSILNDYKDFFSQLEYNKEKIQEINSQIAEVLLDHYEKIEPIFKDLDIKKEFLLKIKNKEEFIITSKLIFLVSILGGFVHIGAEYGKLNEIRRNLNLEEIIEPETPQERFNIFRARGLESGILRFLFKKSEPFIYFMTYSGKEDFPSSPIDNEVRTRIRIVDFYFKLKKVDMDEIFRDCNINKEEFKGLVEKLNYFRHDKEGELKNDFEKIIADLNEGNKNINEWIEIFNNKIVELKKTNRLKIRQEILKRYFLDLILENYVDNLFLKSEIPKSIVDKLQKIFLNEEVIELTESMRREVAEVKSPFFYGIKHDIGVEFKEEDILELAKLFNKYETLKLSAT